MTNNQRMKGCKIVQEHSIDKVLLWQAEDLYISHFRR